MENHKGHQQEKEMQHIQWNKNINHSRNHGAKTVKALTKNINVDFYIQQKYFQASRQISAFTGIQK